MVDRQEELEVHDILTSLRVSKSMTPVSSRQEIRQSRNQESLARTSRVLLMAFWDPLVYGK